MSQFATRAADALAHQYAEFGDPANYVPPGGGAAVPCTIIRDREDRPVGFHAATTHADMVEVRQSELASPAKNGTFKPLDAAGAETGETLTIQDDPHTPEDDPDRLVWRMTVR